MSESVARAETPILFLPDGGSTRVELKIEDRAASHLWINPYTLCIGAARVRMDGIGGVETEPEYRQRGYSRRVMEAAVRYMQAGGRDAPPAVLSMLHGIGDFYPKFGYATAGADYYVALTHLPLNATMPSGWRARPFQHSDLDAVRRLYEQNTARAVGAAVRPEDGKVWGALAKTAEPNSEDACRVVEAPSGQLVAYAWQGRKFWYTDMLQRDCPDILVLAEVMASGPAAADAALAGCRVWAAEVSRTRAKPLEKVWLSLPPEGPVAAAALRQTATFEQYTFACGSSMARVLDVARLLDALRPELARRLQAAQRSERFALSFVTEIGEATLAVTPDGLAVELSPAGDPTVVRLPQSDLARLALGAFPPEDLLARLETPPDAPTTELLCLLFPQRHPHMWLPDR